MNNLNEISLSHEQQSIVDLKEGQHIVLSPPGTGKTELLSHRVICALDSGVDPVKMVCLTFTNRAARVMKERVEYRHSNNPVFVGNVHQFGINFLLKNKLIPQSTSFIDEMDSELLMEEAKGNVNYDFKSSTSYLLSYCTYIKQSKLNFPVDVNRVPSETYENVYMLNKLCQEYDLLKEQSNYMDFDEILTYLYYYLKNEIIHSNQKFDWIQVDEVQDLNPLQLKIIRLIANDNSHIVYFGDKAQSIFSFMGSDLENLNNTIKDIKIHSLNINYRSPSYLSELINIFAQYNNLNEHHLFPMSYRNIDKSEESLIIVNISGSFEQEANFIAEKLLNNLKYNSQEQTAILVRFNKSADTISKYLNYYRIEHCLISGFDLFKRKTVKILLAFLSCLIDEDDRISWSRLINLFMRTDNLKESRNLVNSMFNLGIKPSDFLKENKDSLSELENIYKHISEKRIILFDTETTGLDIENDDIVQLAAVEIINGEIGKEFNAYIKSERCLRESEKVHNISKEFIDKNGISPKEAYEKFYEFSNNDLLMSHNLDFDLEILKKNYFRNGINLTLPQNGFDTLKIVKRIKPNLKTYKLAELIKTFNIEGVNSHNALDDAKAAANLLKYFIPELKRIIEEQKVFFGKYENKIKSFRDYLFPIWKNYKDKFENVVELSIIISDFIKYIRSKHLFTDVTEDKYLFKLIKHMNKNCKKDKLKNLLKTYIPQYKRYKEADLITGAEKIVISTIYKAKGLEFDNVIIPECVNDVYPLWSSNSLEKYQEDARLFYVALSRSKRRIFLTKHTISENQYGKTFIRETSPFLESIINYFKIYQEEGYKNRDTLLF